MGTATFKCPSCGAYIEFDAKTQDFSCPYCLKSFKQDDILDIGDEKESTEFKKSSSGELLYNCKNCGAEIVTDETTAATSCYFCHSPIILVDKLSNEYRPDRIIPFAIDREAALKMFKDFISKKHFIPKGFFEKSQLEKMAGVYYPYWDCDYDCIAEFNGIGKDVRVSVVGNYNVTTTRNYKVIRTGRILFNNIFRNALRKNQQKLADGIHPFDHSKEKDYSIAFLSGFMAERRDVDTSEIEKDVEIELKRYVEPLLTSTSTYSSLSGNSIMKVNNKSFNNLLLPTWVLTYMGSDKKQYYFSINGQTGNVCGILPLNRGKLFCWSAIAGFLVAGLLLLGGMFLW